MIYWFFNAFEKFGNPEEIPRKSLEIRKSLTNLSGNPEILVKIFGISEIPEISYAILGSEMPLVKTQITPILPYGVALERA